MLGMILQPMKMDLIEDSETSAIINQTPGNYSKENLLYSVHGESLKSRISYLLRLRSHPRLRLGRQLAGRPAEGYQGPAALLCYGRNTYLYKQIVQLEMPNRNQTLKLN